MNKKEMKTSMEYYAIVDRLENVVNELVDNDSKGPMPDKIVKLVEKLENEVSKLLDN